MRIVFLGSGEFAVPALERLAEAGHIIPLVFTQPDRPAGRGAHLHPTPVKEKAAELGLPVYQPETLKGPDPTARLRAEAPRLCVVAAYGHRLPNRMLMVPALGFINAHASILPKYRGAAPVPHAILNGERETGVTIFRVQEAWDSGPIYASARTPIEDSDTSGIVLDRLAGMGAELLVRVVADLESDRGNPLPQEDGAVTLAPKLRHEDGRIDWSRTAAQIDRQVRAFLPWPVAYTYVHDPAGNVRVLQVLGVKPEPARTPSITSTRPGTILEADPRRGLLVAVGKEEALRITRVKPAAKRTMDSAAFLRGHPLEKGMILGAEERLRQA
jgi:methionyl-tRNA formyltransferase